MKKLISLLTDLDEDHIKFYQAACSSNKNYTKSQIRRMNDEERDLANNRLQNFPVASDSDETCEVGRITPLGAKDSSHVMIFTINHITDPKFLMRESLFTKKSLGFEWKTGMKLLNRSENRQSWDQELQKKEFGVLKKIIHQFNDNQQFHILSYPKDEIIMLPSSKSVACKLLNYFCKLNDGGAQSKLVFIGPINPQIVDVKEYVQAVILKLVDEHLTALSELYIVLDLPVLCQKLESVVPPNPEGTGMIGKFGVDAKSSPVTCVLLHYTLQI